MSTTVDILCFISTCITPHNEMLKVKYAFSLEVVCRGSETQLQVTEKLQVTEILN